MQRLLCSDVDGTIERWQVVMKWLKVLAKDYPAIHEMMREAEPLVLAYKKRTGAFEIFVEFIVRKFWHEKRFVGIHYADSVQAARTAMHEEGALVYVFARELVLAAKENGYRTAAISGSPQEAVEVFMEPLGFDIIRATVHAVDAQGVFVDAPLIDDPVLDKGLALRQIADTLGNVDLSESIVIGDSMRDVPMLELAGYPICFKPNRELRAVARQRRWPTVVEDRNTHHIMVYDERTGHRIETDRLTDLLPKEIAAALGKRLSAIPW